MIQILTYGRGLIDNHVSTVQTYTPLLSFMRKKILMHIAFWEGEEHALVSLLRGGREGRERGEGGEGERGERGGREGRKGREGGEGRRTYLNTCMHLEVISEIVDSLGIQKLRRKRRVC